MAEINEIAIPVEPVVPKVIDNQQIAVYVNDLGVTDIRADLDAEIARAQAAEDALSEEIATKEDIFRYSTMPIASAARAGEIAQYIGATTSAYTSGYFYKCELSEGAYVWRQVNVGEAGPTRTSELINDSGFIDKDVTDLTNYYRKTETYQKSEVYAKGETYPKESLYTKTDVYTKTEVNEKIEELKNNPDVVDIVQVYDNTGSTESPPPSDLVHYNTSALGDKDIIRVLTDNNPSYTQYAGMSIFYKWNKTAQTWSFVGVAGDYYTRAQVDAKIGVSELDLTNDDVTAEYDDGIVIEATGQTTHDDSNTDTYTVKLKLPLLAGDGITIAADEDDPDVLRINSQTTVSYTSMSPRNGYNITIGTDNAPGAIIRINGADVRDDSKQAMLVSGSNIKTINGHSILGAGDLEILADKTFVLSKSLL